MGIGVNKLYATNLGSNGESDPDVFLSEWVPVYHNEGNGIWYSWPSNTPIGKELYCVPNLLNIQIEDGSVEVKLELCEEETGLYLIHCKGDYFAEDMFLCNYKPEFREGTFHIKHSDCIEHGTLCVNMNLGTKIGNIYNVKYVRACLL